MGFAKDFLWGAATSSAQVEGGYDMDGRSLSIWDVAPKHKIVAGEDCHESAMQRTHYQEDVAIMKKMGLKAYRFSISWSRVMPKPHFVSKKGLEYYSNLVDELLGAGIEPLVTLYHWDLPLWAYEEGGWESESLVPHFAEFAETVVKKLSNRVRYWITFNEPSCFLMNGYMQGVHAPFKRKYLSLPKITRVFMLANKAAVETIRANAVLPPKIGLSFAFGVYLPEIKGDQASEEAAYKKSFSKQMGVMNNAWFLKPILEGKKVWAYGIYHTKGNPKTEYRVNFDFIAINVYSAFDYGSYGGNPKIDRSKVRFDAIGNAVDGDSLYYAVKFLYRRYHLPILISENGMAGVNEKVEEGHVHDSYRSEYIKEYLRALKKAIEEGNEVIGYCHWSLLDNFEWAEGYRTRFGLVYVDWKTKQRTIKDSFYEYSKIIADNGKNLG